MSDKRFEGFSREKYYFHNTLMCLVKSLQGKNITLDLRNDSCVCGNITIVDGFMNISFDNAVYCDPQGNEYSFENLFVPSRNIRYVHIPDSISILSAIKKEFYKSKAPDPIKKPQVSRKVKKAMKQHMETVASLDI